MRALSVVLAYMLLKHTRRHTNPLMSKLQEDTRHRRLYIHTHQNRRLYLVRKAAISPKRERPQNGGKRSSAFPTNKHLGQHSSSAVRHLQRDPPYLTGSQPAPRRVRRRGAAHQPAAAEPAAQAPRTGTRGTGAERSTSEPRLPQTFTTGSRCPVAIPPAAASGAAAPARPRALTWLTAPAATHRASREAAAEGCPVSQGRRAAAPPLRCSPPLAPRCHLSARALRAVLGLSVPRAGEAGRRRHSMPSAPGARAASGSRGRQAAAMLRASRTGRGPWGGGMTRARFRGSC